MLNYEKFKQEIVGNILSYMSEKYQDYKVKVIPTYKINVIIDSLSVEPNDHKQGYAPSFNLNQLYQNYLNNQDPIEVVLNILAGHIEDALSNVPEYVEQVAEETNLLLKKESVIIQLINTDLNTELLSICPHRPFQDLSIIYRQIVHMADDGMATVIIKNEFMEKMNITEEELFEAAIVNTKTLLCPKVNSMRDMIQAMFPGELPDDYNADEEKMPMFVISNERAMNGSSSMLYEDVMQGLAEKVNSNLYIMPSSIHEVIALPADSVPSVDALSRMVEEVNATQVADEEILSDHVYLYDKDTRRMSVIL